MRKQPLSFRIKMIIIFCTIIAVVVLTVSVVMITISNNHMNQSTGAQLNILTEGALLSFSNRTDAMSEQLLSNLNKNGVIAQLFTMKDIHTEDTGYYTQKNVLETTLSEMVNLQSSFDFICVKLNNGLLFTNRFAAESLITESKQILSGKSGEKQYGRPQWLRTENGDLYLVRDIYNTQPLRHLGRAIAHVRQSEIIYLGDNNRDLQCSVVFLSIDGNPISVSGENTKTVLTSAQYVALHPEKNYYNHMFATVIKNNQWTAVGLMPETTITAIRNTVVLWGIGVAGTCILFGSIIVWLATRRMTRQIQALSRSMDMVTNGNLEVSVPVISKDEVGQLASHFNSMIGNTKDLLNRIVQEETQKNKIEYDLLEYKYRSLQTQINPHFIYNALEVVNSMGKLNGSNQICDVVQHISTFFRLNSRKMQRKFVPVSTEFRGLMEYTKIFQYIYANHLETYFDVEPDVEDALIPTMILQPLLENALIHGRSDESYVGVTASKENDSLIIRVSDHGKGITQEKIALLLDDKEIDTSPKTSEGIGIRNVRDRLHLLYGDKVIFTMQSPEHNGLHISIVIPLEYE